MNLAKTLRSFRMKNDLTQFIVADELGYSTSQFISNWERGFSCPPPEAFKRLVRLYNLNAHEQTLLFCKIKLFIRESTESRINKYR